MNIKRLENLRNIIREIKFYEEEISSYIAGVDTTRVPIQSGKTSNPTESQGIKLICDREYRRLLKERYELLNYIISVKDETVKEIAICRFIKGQTFEEIAKNMNYDRRTVSRKLNSYIQNN